jgi:phosphonopyruvate decarboxylase
MIDPRIVIKLLSNNNVDFFTGVPDSSLKYFCSYLLDNIPPRNHMITTDEGAAIALAAGRYLATKEISLVYMQNAGLGNSYNPLVSLTHPSVYNIPLLLMIGWRGKPGVKDESQHTKQGSITLPTLKLLDIPYYIVPKQEKDLSKCINKVFDVLCGDNPQPVALVVEPETFTVYKSPKEENHESEITREQAIQLLVDSIDSKSLIVSTTGKASRELFEYRKKLKDKHNKDFLTVGSMGYSSQIALGVALAKPEKEVFCLDGDGAILMHMGNLAINGTQQLPNFKHIIVNNVSHDSVGGQPTVGNLVSFCDIAKACGYKATLRASTFKELERNIDKLKYSQGPVLLEIKVKKGARSNLGRPTIPLKEMKSRLIKFLEE